MKIINTFSKIKYELFGPSNKYISCIFRRGFIFRQLFNRRKPDNNADYLSIVIIIKDEMPYLQEWIEYHLLVGVERFYVYDNGSTDNPLEVLQPYIEKGIVIYRYFPGNKQQIPAYCDAILKYKYRSYWIALIDTDEFIVPVRKYTVPEVLKEFEQYSGVCLSWVMYDSSGHIKKPEGLVIKNYTHRNIDPHNRANKSIKSIVNPREVLVTNVHWCYYRFFCWGVSESGKKIKGNYVEEPSIDILRINHYYTKSREEFLLKINKGGANGRVSPEIVVTDVEDEAYISSFFCIDRVMDKYVHTLEKKMNKK